MADKLQKGYPQSPPSNDLLSRLALFNLHFGRYVRDGIGLLLIGGAIVSTLGLWGVTGGLLLTPWSQFLAVWFGWGSYLLLAGAALMGVGRRDTSPIQGQLPG
jgi:hypothetical protein